MTKITNGCYVKTSDIKDTTQWKKVIDAFVNAGYEELEGYSNDACRDYSEVWDSWRYVGVDKDGDIVHLDWDGSYHEHEYLTKLTVNEVLSQKVSDNEPSFHIEKNLSNMADQSKIETLEDLYSKGWKLAGIEPSGDYIFYRGY